jgi:hypothetical protein
VSIIDALEEIWTTILHITELFVIPDWGALIALLPVFIFLGVVGPLLTFTMLGTVIYQARKPRVKVTFEEGPRLAEIGPGGDPVFAVGLPFCRRDAIVYTSGTNRCETCNEPLAVTCPMCGLGRAAIIDTCTNCGLVLQVKPRAIAVRTAGPKPGGAAAA